MGRSKKNRSADQSKNVESLSRITTNAYFVGASYSAAKEEERLVGKALHWAAKTPNDPESARPIVEPIDDFVPLPPVAKTPPAYDPESARPIVEPIDDFVPLPPAANDTPGWDGVDETTSEIPGVEAAAVNEHFAKLQEIAATLNAKGTLPLIITVVCGSTHQQSIFLVVLC